MADVDPEVERLARFLLSQSEALRWENYPLTIHDTYRAEARAVLADLRERYVMVPRDLWDQVTTGHVEIRRLEPSEGPLGEPAP